MSPKELRPELERPLPDRMTPLPVDRGYPVPWFVEWIPGEDGYMVPEFRATSRYKFNLAISHKLCWVCGQPLGVHLAFVIGPMCGITRTTSEPPCHLECATWSARNCPFLVRPHATRRELDHPDAKPPAGISIDRNPGVSLVWVCRDYEVFKDGRGGLLIHVGDPEAIAFFAEGRPATRAQIDASIESGLPILKSVETAPEALAALDKAIATFARLLPQ